MPENKYGSQAEFAKYIGAVPSYVTKLKSMDRLVYAPDGRQIDFERSVARIKATADPDRVNNGKNAKEKLRTASPVKDAEQPKQEPVDLSPVPEADEHQIQYVASRAEEKEYAAKLKQLTYEKELGKLVYREDIEKYIARAIRIARDKLVAMPAKLAPRLTVEMDQKNVYAIMEKEINDVIAEIQQGLAGFRS